MARACVWRWGGGAVRLMPRPPCLDAQGGGSRRQAGLGGLAPAWCGQVRAEARRVQRGWRQGCVLAHKRGGLTARVDSRKMNFSDPSRL